MKTIIISAALLLLAAEVTTAQSSGHRSRYFQEYQIDTLHITGNSATMKRNVIKAQKQEGIRSAFWDEIENVLTVEYDSDLLDLGVIRAYFVSNVTARTIVIVARLKKTEGSD